MYKNKFVMEEARKSREQKLSTVGLRSFIFSIIDEVSVDVFGDRYSTKCAQTSIAIMYALARLNISSTLVLGDACLPNICANPVEFGWHGFWGQQHHYWVMTEFEEIVDLSVSKIHEHPMSRAGALSSPPIWYSTKNGVVPFLKYLPRGARSIDFKTGFPEVCFDMDNDQISGVPADIEMLTYKKKIEKRIDFELGNAAVTAIKLRSILWEGLGPDSAAKSDNLFLKFLPEFLDFVEPMPDWIINRERKLLEKYD